MKKLTRNQEDYADHVARMVTPEYKKQAYDQVQAWANETDKRVAAMDPKYAACVESWKVENAYREQPTKGASMYTVKYGRKGQVKQYTERWQFEETAMQRFSDLTDSKVWSVAPWSYVEVWHDTDLYGGTEVCHAVFTR